MAVSFTIGRYGALGEGSPSHDAPVKVYYGEHRKVSRHAAVSLEPYVAQVNSGISTRIRVPCESGGC